MAEREREARLVAVCFTNHLASEGHVHVHTHACVPPSIYDVLSFLGDLYPRVPLSTSSPRQLVQPLRLSAASQRPPKPATLLSPRVRISKDDIFPTNAPFCPPTRGILLYLCTQGKYASACDRDKGEGRKHFHVSNIALFSRIFSRLQT